MVIDFIYNNRIPVHGYYVGLPLIESALLWAELRNQYRIIIIGYHFSNIGYSAVLFEKAGLDSFCTPYITKI